MQFAVKTHPPIFVLLREICSLSAASKCATSQRAKMRERKVRSGVNCLWGVKAKRLKTHGHNQDLDVIALINLQNS
jgi:hypothetical protein